MTRPPVRAGADWLALREPADAAARSRELVEDLRLLLPTSGVCSVHDLGCGTGSMARWLAPQLVGAQHWVMHDRDVDLLRLAAADPPARSRDGVPVTHETSARDITDPGTVTGADLVTASALLDMLTAEELDRLVGACVGADCPVLVTLTVVGRVELVPADPLDERITQAFNAHQRRRVTGGSRLLGPDAVRAAVDGFSSRGLEVVVRETPWRLGPGDAVLVRAWFDGWLRAACEQQPDLLRAAGSYAERRLAELGAGRLSVVVHHEDLLALPA